MRPTSPRHSPFTTFATPSARRWPARAPPWERSRHGWATPTGRRLSSTCITRRKLGTLRRSTRPSPRTPSPEPTRRWPLVDYKALDLAVCSYVTSTTVTRPRVTRTSGQADCVWFSLLTPHPVKRVGMERTEKGRYSAGPLMGEVRRPSPLSPRRVTLALSHLPLGLSLVLFEVGPSMTFRTAARRQSAT